MTDEAGLRTPANPADEGLRDVIEIEEQYIAARTGADGETPAPARTIRTGLALSGGGIRSATFSLGMLQALSRARLISSLDYISTVSGGSYIGSFFGALYVPPEKRGTTTKLTASEEAAFVEQPLQSPRGRRAVANLREFGRYLTPGGASDTMYGIGTIGRNWVTLQIVLGLVPLLFFLTIRLLQTPELLDPLISLVEDLQKGGWDWLIGFGIFLGQAKILLKQLSDQQFSGVLMLLTLGLALFVCSAGLAYWHSRREAVPRNLFKRLVTNLLFVGAIAATAILIGMPSSRHQLSDSIVRFHCLISDVQACDQPPLYATFAIVSVLGLSVVFYLWALWAERSFLSTVLEQRREKPAAEEENVRGVLTRWLATLLVLTIVIGAATLVDYLGGKLAFATLHFGNNWDKVKESLGNAETYGGLRLAWQFFWPFVAVSAPAGLTVRAHGALRRSSGPGWLMKPSGQAALGLSILFLWMVIWAAIARSLAAWFLPWAWLLTLIAIGIISVCYGFLNQSSLVSLYATRLKRAYVGASNPEPGNHGFDIGREGDTVPMEVYYGKPDADSLAAKRPIHLINLTIAQTQPDGASHVVAYDRKGKPMHLSPAGLVFEKDGAGRCRRESLSEGEQLSLSTWTAISGAAASTAIGSQTSAGLSILAMMANVRLGYWWRTTASGWYKFFSPKNSMLGYLLDEMQSSFSTDPDRQRWYLTDGGHFENTGAYALIQRRLDFIVVCDNGADPDYRLDDVVRLIDRARSDLGAGIEFLDSDELDRLVGKNSDLRACFGSYVELASKPPLTEDERKGKPAPYAALARITYDIDDRNLATQRPDPHRPADGLMMLIKPRLNFTEPPELLAYQRRDGGAAFPQQTTLDQFFDEDQWEAYRRFGEIVGERLFAATGGWTPAGALRGAGPPKPQPAKAPARRAPRRAKGKSGDA